MSMICKRNQDLGDEAAADDVFDIIEDDGVGAELAPGRTLRPPVSEFRPSWRVLVVDDDIEVHAATTFALAGVEIMGRPLALEHAHSGAEALDILRERDDFAVILLDVVMESDDAGLRVARAIREELGQTTVRIILRTGQPGYAPELTVIRDYDINDYRTKSELTHTRLLSSLFVAFRAYGHILSLDMSRRGLEKIVTASADLFRRRSLIEFCEGILIQIGCLLSMDTDGIVLVRRRAVPEAGEGAGPIILAAAGRFSDLAGAPLDAIPDERLKLSLLKALEGRRGLFEARTTILHIAGPSGDDVAVYLPTSEALEPIDRKLLEVFCSNIAVGFDNIGLIENVRNLAFYDPLTRLPNRNQFQLEIEKRLAAPPAGRGEAKLAVVLIDIDHFQMINDGLGHPVGDALLRSVAAELVEAFGDPGSVSRLSGDLFGILAWVRGEEDEASLVDLIGLCFARSFTVKDNALTVTTSGGYTVIDPRADDVTSAIRRAGMALKRAKRAGRCQIVRYTGVMAEDLRNRLTLVNSISEAKTNDELSLHYQPQLSLADGGVVGVEALLRWRRPDGVSIRPDIFIPAAEESGHIVSLGDWVLRQACLKQVAWRQNGVGRLRVAVNVSVRQLRERDFTRGVERILAACGADPADIELEITESAAMDGDRILGTVQELRDFGFRIAIDDFGTGHSSLARLRRLPVAMLKIDRGFVDGIEARPDCRSIASMIIKMGHELGLSVLAEGVETAAQEAVLRDLGCDCVQGYFYAKPIPPEDLVVWLRGRTLAIA